ncbi:MAG: hypothetical protein QXV75_03640 [Candidatus Bathyarchaeia archaeon]
MAEKPIHKYVGLGLILIGIVLIVLAAYIAYQSFYSYRLPWFYTQASNIEAAIISLVNTLVELAARLGFLGLMVWAGSILLRYGVQSLRLEQAHRQE